MGFDVAIVFNGEDVGLIGAVGAVGAFNAPVFQVTAYGGLRWGYQFANLGGPNLSLGIQFPLPIPGTGTTTTDPVTNVTRTDYHDVAVNFGIRVPDPTGPISDYTQYFEADAGAKLAGVLEGVTIGYSFETEEEQKVTSPRLQFLGGHLGGKGDDSSFEATITLGWEFMLVGYSGNDNAVVSVFKKMPTGEAGTSVGSSPYATVPGEKVSLQSHHNGYVGVQPDGTVYGHVTALDNWEKFTLIESL